MAYKFLNSLTVINSTFSPYNSGGTANDSLRISSSNLGASFGVQNTNASGYAGIEYIDNSGSVKVFTGFNNSNGQEFRFNNIASGGYIDFLIGGTTGLKLFNNRNVTIGSATDAGYKLDVNGTQRVFGQLEVLSQNSTQGILLKHTALSTTATQIYYNSANAVTYLDTLFSYTASQPFGSVDIRTKDSSNTLTSRLYVEGNSGNVGIGTTTFLGKFQVGSGSATQFQVASSGASIYVGPSSGNYNMNITTNTIQSSNSGTTNTYLYIQPNGTGNVAMCSSGTNKVLIGTTTDAGFKLDVNGTARVITSLQVGNFTPGVAGAASTILTQGRISASGGITFYNPAAGDNQDVGFKAGGNGVAIYINNGTIGSFGGYGASLNPLLSLSSGFNPSSGTGNKTVFGLTPTYQTSGTFSGGITGILYNPALSTLTGVTYHRAIETVSGDVIFGSSSGNVGIGTTTLGTATELTLSGSQTASSAIARGGLINTTLVAAANNDVLVGLDITPTFTNGAFTGVINYGIRTSGDIAFASSATRYLTMQSPSTSGSGGNMVIQSASANTSGTGGNLYLYVGGGAGGPGPGKIYIGNNNGWDVAYVTGILTVSSTGPNTGDVLRVSGGGRNALTIAWDNLTPFMSYSLVSGRQSRFLSSSSYYFDNNFLIGTTTDAGFKLDVNGTARIQNTLNMGTSTDFQISGTSVVNKGISRLVGNGNGLIFSENMQAAQIAFQFVGNGLTTGNSKAFLNTGGKSVFNINVGLGNPNTTGCDASVLLLDGIHNITSFSNTIIRGIYYNPTLTSLTGVVSHRAIETATGDIYFGSTSGKVGIGIAPSSVDILSVGGHINLGAYKLYNGSANDSAGLWFNSNVTNISGYSGISFRSSAAGIQSQLVRMTIFPTGNVAIGTTTDAGYKLDVNGTARATSVITDTITTTGSTTLAGYSGSTYTYGPLTANQSTYTFTFGFFNVLYGNITSGYVPKANTIGMGDSAIYNSGSNNVLIGSTTDNGNKLQVTGNVTVSSNISSSTLGVQNSAEINVNESGNNLLVYADITSGPDNLYSGGQVKANIYTSSVTTPTTINTGTTVSLMNWYPATTQGVMIDYVFYIDGGTYMRSGTFTAVNDTSGNAQYVDNATPDLNGSTSTVTFAAVNNGGTMEFQVTNTSGSPVYMNILTRYIPTLF